MRNNRPLLARGLTACAAFFCATAVWAQQDVTQPGDPIFPSSANSPPSEGVANVIDNTTTKYLNFDSGRDGASNKFSPSGFVVIPSIGVTHVTGMTIETANDGPERDPKTVTLEGSNDASITNYTSGNWTMITTIDVPVVTGRYFVQSFSFTNNSAYKAYRWTVTETAGMGSANTCCMQVAEVELLGSALPQDVTQPGDPVIASSANSPPSEGVANIIDNTTTKYLNFDSGRDGASNKFSPSGFIVTPAIGRTLVTGMTIESANDGPERDPKSVTLEGSNDTNITTFAGGNWEAITTIDVPIFAARYQTQTFLFDNVKPYKSYRWTVNETAGMGSANTCCMQVAEVELLGTGAPQDVTQPGDPVIASSANSPPSEGVANIIDNTTTKYLNFDSGRDGASNKFSPSGFIVTPAVGATAVIGMTIESANDGPERDPKTVTLEGSNDTNITTFASGTWDLITTIDVPLFTGRYQVQEFYFQNPKAYKSYRWTVTETAGMGSANTCCMQVAEVELLAVTTSAPASARFLAQPIDAPTLLGQPATFYTTVNGPWPLQWRKNGVNIPGATKTSYTTDPLTADSATNVYDVQIVGQGTSDPVHAVVFNPSATKSIGVKFLGDGSNGSGAASAVDTNSVIGFWPQAYWNNAPGGSGDLPDPNTDPVTPLLDSSGAESTVTFNYATGGNWGSGTGIDTPLQRLLNGTVGAAGPGTDNILTFANVPDGTHSVLVYVVSPPLQFQTVSYKITGTTEQTYYIRAMNSDEYKAAPGFYRGTSTNASSPTVADFVRFDNVHPVGGTITLTVNVLNSAAQRTGVNAVQLVLNAPATGAPPSITADPQPTAVLAGGTAKFSVTATGTGLTYQWLKNGRTLPNGANVSGSTSSTLSIANAGSDDEASYSVAVFNAAGSALSKTASLTLSKFNISDQQSAYFTFDATSGSTAANAVTGGQAGQVNGNPTWAAGKVGNGFTFDGSTIITVTNYTKPTKGFSVSLLVNADPSTSSAVSFVRDAVNGLNVVTTTAGLFDLGLSVDANDGSVHLSVSFAVGPNIYTATDPQPFTLGTFHQVAFTADGAQLRLYNDGNEVAETDYTGSLNSPAVAFLTIGGGVVADSTTGDLSLDPNNAFIGKIDDLSVWNRSLTATEVTALNTAATSGKALSTIVETPPVTTGPTLTVARSGSNITITWTGTGFRLQSSDKVDTGYADVAGVTGNSFTTSSATGAKYFRMVQ